MLRKLAPVLIVLSACGGDEAEPTVTADNRSLCTNEARAETFSAGMSKDAIDGVTVVLERVTVEGVESAPDRGLNVWTLRLADAGQPMDQARVELRTWMPDHGHGTSPNNLTAEAVDGAPGTYEVGPFNLFMGGFWTFDVTVDDGEPLQFAFCLEG